MLQYNPTVTGSLQVSGDITGTVNGINITGLSQSVSTQLISVQVSTGSSDAKFETLSGVTSSALTRLTNIESKSASVDISISNINSVTASNIARLSNLETKSSSVDISISSINTFTSSNDTKFTTLGTYTGSLDTKNTTLAAVTSSLISKTGSYATTGSNQFYGTQVFSGSVYIANDLVVQGSSSIQYISASSVSIGTNIVQLNTANPSVRFAGLTIIDSGSIGGSGSFLYDSVHDEFVFVHRGNGTNVTSSHFVLGPETYDSLGNETYLTCNIITKGTGKEHLMDSCIFDNGTTTCIKNNLIGTGTACFTSTLIAGGNALIGTSTPSTAISLNDILTIGASTTSNAVKFTNGGTTNWGYIVTEATKIVLGTDNNIDFETGGGCRRMRITSTGISCFACQVCAPSFIGGTISGTTIYGSTAVCSALGLFSGCIGIGTTSPSSPLSICGTFNGNTPFICMTGTGTGVYQRVIAAINPGMNAGDDLTIQMGTALCYRNVGQLNYHHEGSGCATNRMSIGLYGVDDVFNVTGNGFVGIGTCTPGTALEVSSRAADADRTLPHNVLTITAIQGQAPYGFFGGSILFKNTSYTSGVVCSARIRSVIYDDGAPANCGGGIWLETTPTPGGTLTPSLKINYAGVACFASNVCGLSFLASSNIQASGANSCVIINRTDGTPAVLSLGNTSNAYQIHYTCTSGQRLAFINGAPSEFASFYGTGVSVFTGQTCINGSGAGLQFTGGNNRIYFGACRAIEGSTSGTSLQLGEHYTKLSLQAHGQFSCGVGGGSPKLFFGEEGPETAGAKAIYLESYWMILQPHYNEGLRIRAVNASGTQRTLAEFYGSGEVYFASMAAAAGTYNVKWTSGGRITYDTSSCRYKSNIRNSVYGLCDILKLNSRMFEYKDGGRTDVGLIAEEVNQVIPELAIKNPEGQPDAVSYDRMVSVLIKGMQEQQCIINLLKSCIGIS